MHFQVQRQLQMRIEAQGKYLQKIIEEQQKLGSTLKASKNSPPAIEDTEKVSQSQPPPEASGGGSTSPRKRQKVHDGVSQTKDGNAQWDQNLYGSNDVFGLDAQTKFKQGEEAGSKQMVPVELNPICGPN